MFKRTNSVEAGTSQAVLVVQMVCNVLFSTNVSYWSSSLVYTGSYNSLSIGWSDCKPGGFVVSRVKRGFANVRNI